MIKTKQTIKETLAGRSASRIRIFLLILVGGGLLTPPFLVIVGMGQILSMRFSLQLLPSA